MEWKVHLNKQRTIAGTYTIVMPYHGYITGIVSWLRVVPTDYVKATIKGSEHGQSVVEI